MYFAIFLKPLGIFISSQSWRVQYTHSYHYLDTINLLKVYQRIESLKTAIIRYRNNFRPFENEAFWQQLRGLLIRPKTIRPKPSRPKPNRPKNRINLFQTQSLFDLLIAPVRVRRRDRYSFDFIQLIFNKISVYWVSVYWVSV